MKQPKRPLVTALTLGSLEPETAEERGQRSQQFVEHLARSLTREQLRQLRRKTLRKAEPRKPRGRPQSSTMATMFADHQAAGISYEENITILARVFGVAPKTIRNRFPKYPRKK